MASRAPRVREAELARVFRAAKKAGIFVRVVIEDGRVTITPTKPEASGGSMLDEMFG